MDQAELLLQLSGLQTIETVAKALHIKRQSALNVISRLKKEGYITVQGGGKRKRLYTITATKQRPRQIGMWDILNQHNPNFKLNPWYDHQVHGGYSVEEALIDAISSKSFRIILASLILFNHIKNWPRLYLLAKEKNCWQKVAALYELARNYIKVRKMPQRYKQYQPKQWQLLTQLKTKHFPEISNRWKVYIPFNEQDIGEINA